MVLPPNSSKVRTRVLGIDAPEIPHGNKPGQPYGEEARDYLDHLIGGKTVRGNGEAGRPWKRSTA
jgi:endonuclease YncB( thermonuclease family)